MDHQGPTSSPDVTVTERRDGLLAALLAPLRGSRVTAVIIGVCLALAALSQAWGSHGEVLWRMGANDGADLRHGEVWRLFASAYLHAGLLHLSMNMYVLWSVGPFLETILGPRRYLLLYGAAALGGSLASGLLGANHLSVGASGAIWGLMAAAFALAMRPRGVLPPRVAEQMKRSLRTSLLINLGISFLPGIDLRAHLGGGVVGFALMATVLTAGLTPLDQRATPADAERSPSPLLSGAAALMAAAMAASIVVALITGRPWALNAAPVLRRTALAGTGLTLDVPAAIAEEKSLGDEAIRSRTFLSGRGTPVTFQIIVIDLSEEVPGPAIDAFMESAREGLDTNAPAKAVRSRPAQRVMLGARPAVLVEHDLDGQHLATYLEVVGTHQVVVRGYSGKERPASWQGVEEKVAASLAME